MPQTNLSHTTALQFHLLHLKLGYLTGQKKKSEITTRKLLTMNESLHQSSDTNRIYTKRKQGGRGLKYIEDLYNVTISC